MPIGRTAHSKFNIPTNYGQYLSGNVGKKTNLATLVNVALIKWDTTSMALRENVSHLI